MCSISHRLFQLSALLDRAGVSSEEDVLHVEFEPEKPAKVQLRYDVFPGVCRNLGVQLPEPEDESLRRVSITADDGTELFSRKPTWCAYDFSSGAERLAAV